MNFLNPFVLFGLIASSIPIIIHLLNLRRKKKTEFSSLMFLKQLQDNKIRKLKIKQWLLILLRTLIITFAILALARPTIDTPLPGLETYSKTNTILLVDNSISMELSDEYGNRLRRAKNISQQILEVLEFGDKASIMDLSDSRLFFSKDFDKSKTDLADINYDLFNSSMFSQLNSILSYDEVINKNLIIVSDGDQNLFNDFDTLNNLNSNSSIKFIKLDGKTKFQNISIDSVKVLNSIYQINKQIELEVYLNNHSEQNISNSNLNLFVNQKKVSQKSIKINGNSQEIIKVSFQLSSYGFIDAYLELSSDDIMLDNKFYFGFVVPEKPKLALITSQESSFIELALNLSEIDLDVFNSNELSSSDINDYDIIFLSDGKLNNTTFNRLKNFISNGGKLVLFDNPKNELNQNVFLKEIGFDIISRDTNSILEFSKIEKLHPIFDGVFEDSKKNAIVESPKIKNALSVNGQYSIIETEKGGFVSEVALEKGKCIFIGSSNDLNSSNLPLTGIYPSLLNRIIYYLSAGSKQNRSDIDNKVILNISKNLVAQNKFKLISPNGKEKFLQSVNMPSGPTLILSDLNDTGNFKIINSKEKPIGIISINHNSLESKINFLDNKQLENTLRAYLPSIEKIEIVDQESEIDQSFVRSQMGTEIWKIFIILAIVCALIEMIVQRTKIETTS